MGKVHAHTAGRQGIRQGKAWHAAWEKGRGLHGGVNLPHRAESSKVWHRHASRHATPTTIHSPPSGDTQAYTLSGRWEGQAGMGRAGAHSTYNT